MVDAVERATQQSSASSGLSIFDVLQVGASIAGLAGPQPVKILAVERLTDDSANVLYRTETGPAERIVFANQLEHIRAVQPGLATSSGW